MCQHRKSELLYFLSIISSGVSLSHDSGDVERSNCRGSIHWPLGASLGTHDSHCSFCWSMDFCEAKSLSYLGHLHISWDLALQLQDLLVSMSHRVRSRSPLFGEVCTTREPLLKISLHGKIVYKSFFLLSGNNSEFGRRGSQKKVVRIGDT